MKNEDVKVSVKEELLSPYSSDDENFREASNASPIESDEAKISIEGVFVKCENNYERVRGEVQNDTDKNLRKDFKTDESVTKIKEEADDIEVEEQNLPMKREREDDDEENFPEWNHTYSEKVQEKSTIQCGADKRNKNNHDRSFVKEEITEGMCDYFKFFQAYLRNA